jgi:hypothetical protein
VCRPRGRLEVEREAVVVDRTPHPEGLFVDDVGDTAPRNELDASLHHPTGPAGEPRGAVADLADRLAARCACGHLVDDRRPPGQQPGIGEHGPHRIGSRIDDDGSLDLLLAVHAVDRKA